MVARENGSATENKVDGSQLNNIVVFGMSCSGKTTFAKQLNHSYCCFDARFPWNDIETLGLSTELALSNVAKFAMSLSSPYVVDGWHLSDPEGEFLPDNCSVCCVYADYDTIIGQYRVPVQNWNQHVIMFKKWYYEIKYSLFPKCHFVENKESIFRLTSLSEFQNFLDRQRSVLLRQNVI